MQKNNKIQEHIYGSLQGLDIEICTGDVRHVGDPSTYRIYSKKQPSLCDKCNQYLKTAGVLWDAYVKKQRI